MTNQISNIVSYSGDSKQIRKMLEKIKAGKFGLGTVDFNKIIPMPGYIRAVEDERAQTWSVANWATKWNAYGYKTGADYSRGDSLKFKTAWNAPHPIIAKLSDMFPDVELTHAWADENIGHNCGCHVYHGGKKREEYFPEGRFESIKYALSVMECAPEERGLALNNPGTDYVRIDDDDYEYVEVYGKPALFTNARVTDANIPKNILKLRKVFH